MKKHQRFTPAEMDVITRKITAARRKLLAEGFNSHPRFHFLFRKQIAEMAGVTAEEMDAYNFHLVQMAAEARSVRGRLRRLGQRIGTFFKSIRFA
jgi:hypothetical protein